MRRYRIKHSPDPLYDQSIPYNSLEESDKALNGIEIVIILDKQPCAQGEFYLHEHHHRRIDRYDAEASDLHKVTTYTAN